MHLIIDERERDALTMEEEKNDLKQAKKKSGITRRDFITGTVGGVVVGAAVGAAAGSLGFPRTITQTATETQTATQTQTQTATQTSTATTTATTTQVLTQAPPPLALTINGTPVSLTMGTDANDINPYDTLAYTLREKLGLTGVKLGCKEGDCGSCTVLADDTPILSCMTLTSEVGGRSITTIEGLANPTTGKLHPIQQAFIDNFGFQCGFCTPGMILSAKALLDNKPSATEDDVRTAISGNMCRCTGYVDIVKSILAAEKTLGSH